MNSPIEVARDLTRLLAPTDPASAAACITKLLWFLADLTKAAGGAILVPNTIGPGYVLHATCRLTGDQLAELQAEWKAAEEWVLLRGQAIVTPTRVFQPVIEQGLGQVIAVLYLERAERFDAQVVQPYTEAMGEALSRSQRVTFEDEPSVRPTGRAGLLKTLHEQEWNLARVARVLGVSRRTVYLRMQRYGIERQHVPKSVTRVKRQPGQLT
jgi:hypothetical protein